VYGFEVKILGLIENTDVKKNSGKMVKKGTKLRETFGFCCWFAIFLSRQASPLHSISLCSDSRVT
jgi:hypothetical protein